MSKPPWLDDKKKTDDKGKADKGKPWQSGDKAERTCSKCGKESDSKAANFAHEAGCKGKK